MARTDGPADSVADVDSGISPSRRPRARPTVFRLILAVAFFAILLYFPTGWLRGRRARYLEVADWHGRTGANYGRSSALVAAGPVDEGPEKPAMVARLQVISAWHEHMRREYLKAADRPWTTAPVSRPFPPPGWHPSASD